MTGGIASMLGLCRRAGKVVSGDTATRQSILKNEVKLLILAGDTAKRTKENFIQLAEEKDIPVFCYATKNELGILLGKKPRTVVAITDEQLARGITRAMERGEAGLC